MTNEAKNKTSWLSKHKKAIIIGGVVLTAVTVSGLMLYLNHNQIAGLFSTAKNNIIPVSKTPLMVKRTAQKTIALDKQSFNSVPSKAVGSDIFKPPIQSITVSTNGSEAISKPETVIKDIPMGIRNLPQNQHASAAKIEQAKALNIPLSENQTLYNGFPRKYHRLKTQSI